MSLEDDEEYTYSVCGSCHTGLFDTVDRGDGHVYMRCSCGRVRVEYDELDDPSDPSVNREIDADEKVSAIINGD